MAKETNEFFATALTLLTQVIDPELNIDIVNLGLIYDVILDDKEC